MSKSLQDQLLALGVASKSQAKSSQKRGHNTSYTQTSKAPGKKTRPKKSDPDGLTLEQAYRLREKQTKEQAEQARHLKREEDRRRRQLNRQIRDIVMPNRLNNSAAELCRNFVYKGRIRKVNVTAEQLASLNQGELGVAYLAGGYHILKQDHLALVKELSADHIPDLGGANDDDDEQFPVPDDITW